MERGNHEIEWRLGQKICICFIVLCTLFLTALICVHITTTPSNDRRWTQDQAVLPYAEFNGAEVTIRNIRNFIYASTTAYTPQYYDKTFNLDELESVDFIVEPLKPIAVAHTFVSFGFKDGNHIAVSVEIRKEVGESFSPLRGLFNQFELMYVIADERDVLQLRALHRKDPLYLYPTKISQEKARTLLLSMLTRANTLHETPEFYNTITSTCTTNIVDHINELEKGLVPWDLRVIFPLRSDAYAYELGLIDTSLPFEDLQQRQLINEYVETYADDPNFSQKIRAHMQHTP